MKWNFVTKTFIITQSQTALQNLAELARIRAGVFVYPEILSGSTEGVRTNDTTFTPSVAPAWEEDEHAEKRMLAFIDSDTTTFSAHKIASNTSTAVVIDTTYGDTTLLTGCNRCYLFNSWEEAMGYVKFVQR